MFYRDLHEVEVSSYWTAARRGWEGSEFYETSQNSRGRPGIRKKGQKKGTGPSKSSSFTCQCQHQARSAGSKTGEPIGICRDQANTSSCDQLDAQTGRTTQTCMWFVLIGLLVRRKQHVRAGGVLRGASGQGSKGYSIGMRARLDLR